MLLVKRIIVIMCAKNYKKNKFTFVKVIQKKCRLFFPDTVYKLVSRLSAAGRGGSNLAGRT